MSQAEDAIILDVRSIVAEVKELRAACAALRARAERAEGERDRTRRAVGIAAIIIQTARAKYGFSEHFRTLYAQELCGWDDARRALRAPGGEDL